MRLFVLNILLIVSISATAQVSRCGLPNYIPRKGEAWIVTDTCGEKLSYLYKGSAVWECFTTTFVQESAPQLSQVVGSVTVRWRQTKWYKPSTAITYYGVNGIWETKQFNLDSLLSKNNRWTGKNTFADSLNAEKGLKSGGLIDTKGLKTNSSTSSAAITIEGVYARSDTTITSDYQANYTHSDIIVNTGTTDITVTMPPESQSLNWIYHVKKDNDNMGKVRVLNSSGQLIFTAKNKMSLIIKNQNQIWEISVSF